MSTLLKAILLPTTSFWFQLKIPGTTYIFKALCLLDDIVDGLDVRILSIIKCLQVNKLLIDDRG